MCLYCIQPIVGNIFSPSLYHRSIRNRLLWRLNYSWSVSKNNFTYGKSVTTHFCALTTRFCGSLLVRVEKKFGDTAYLRTHDWMMGVKILVGSVPRKDVSPNITTSFPLRMCNSRSLTFSASFRSHNSY